MILTAYVFETIQTTLSALGYRSYLGLAPTGTVYPYCTYIQSSLPNVRSTLKNDQHIMDTVRIQFSVYGNKMDCSEVITLMGQVESAFELNSFTNGTYTIRCVHKVNEISPRWLDKQDYWQGIIEFDFECERAK